MTVTTALPLLLKQRIDLKTRLKLAGGIGINSPKGAVFLLKRILVYTIAIESIGALLLFFPLLQHGESFFTAVYYSIFHSISAFCNAGFSTYATSLHSFSRTLTFPLVILSLIVLGGIGFPVLSELSDLFTKKRSFLSNYSKTVISTTGLLIGIGALCFVITEWEYAFIDMPLYAKFVNALFASVTPRTAGFETVSYATFSEVGTSLTIMLMIIGASPASTGGGIKTTTFAVLFACMRAELRDEQEVVLFKRYVTYRTMRKALAVVVIYISTLIIGTMLLTFTETESLPNLFFEAVSALGTVGLSRGITANLSPWGKVIIICMMYWGRIGFITFFFSLVKKEKKAHIQYPSGDLPIG